MTQGQDVKNILIIAAMLLASVFFVWIAVNPALNCYDKGGLPVLGIGHVVCAQPFFPLKP